MTAHAGAPNLNFLNYISSFIRWDIDAFLSWGSGLAHGRHSDQFVVFFLVLSKK